MRLVRTMLLLAFLSQAYAEQLSIVDVTASSEARADRAARLSTDGDATTRWSSNYSDNEWLQLDLGSTRSIERVTINWEVAYGRDFDLQTSSDGAAWTTAKEIRGNGSLQNDIEISASARYVRMRGVSRATPYGYSIFEISVQGGTPFVAKPYRCDAKSFSEYRWDYDFVSWTDIPGAVLFYCDTPDGIYRQYFCGNAVRFVKSVVKEGPAAVANYLQTKRTRFCTDPEITVMHRVHESEGVKVIVAPLSGSTTRPIYPQLSNGMRGTTRVGDIPIADKDGNPTPCIFNETEGRWRRLKNADGTPSMYFEVSGGYALCKIVGPISK